MLTLSSELEVLIATVVWLSKNGWVIEAVSVAGGRGLLPIVHQKEEVIKALESESVRFDETLFKSRGPDIVARSCETIWKIECKGLGKGKRSTHKTNFDRAVASAMSYYDAPQTRLGLALANDYVWAYNLGEKLPQALREATNLWVFLLENKAIYPYEPAEELPFPGAV